MTPITQFITARLDEDAQAGAKFESIEIRTGSGNLIAAHTWPIESIHAVEQPERNILLVNALRGILEEHPPAHGVCDTCVRDDGRDLYRIFHPCPTLQNLAAIWKTHPDYQAQWAP